MNELRAQQLALGCAGCRWCDEAARAEGSPCCNRPWGYTDRDDGSCEDREEPLEHEEAADGNPPE